MVVRATTETNPRIVKALRGGQITIPVELRRQLGIQDETLLQVWVDAGELRMRPVQVTGTAPAGSAWLQDLYLEFSSVREEAANLSGEEIDAAIDDAVRAVRSTKSE